MEMELNIDKLKQLRESKAWSQSHLAEVAGISLRTIQRVEKNGIASPESVKAICGSYGIEARDILKNETEQNITESAPLSAIKLKISRLPIKHTIIAFSVAFIIAYILTL